MGGEGSSGGGWRKSSFSGANGCVQTRHCGCGCGAVTVRHSKDPTGPRLAFTAAEWAAFTAGVRAGEFDR